MRDNDPGVPLSHYRQHGADVELWCACGDVRVFDLETVIARLKARGYDENTGIRAVAALVRNPCRKCGGREFESRPRFKTTPTLPGT